MLFTGGGKASGGGRERNLIDLIFHQGLAAQDVATILQVSVGTVYTKKSRILAKLRKTRGKLDSL